MLTPRDGVRLHRVLVVLGVSHQLTLFTFPGLSVANLPSIYSIPHIPGLATLFLTGTLFTLVRIRTLTGFAPL